VSDIVSRIYERRRIISIVSGINVSLFANIFGGHAPEPKSCDAELPPAGFVETQAMSPDIITRGD
jgi:hypothetical protein